MQNFLNKTNLQKKIPLILTLIFLFFVFIPLLQSFSFFFTVSYGKIAIVTRFGKIVRTAEPGLNFKIPFIERPVFYSTQKLVYETSESPSQSLSDYRDNPVDSTTQDGQQVSIRYSVRFQIDPKKIIWVAENLGSESLIVERLVKTETRSVVRNVAREFKAQDLYTGDVFKFQEKLQKILAKKFAENGLILDEILIRQLKFSPDYVSAVEQKQIEKEKVKAEEYRAEQEKYIKEQKITRAEGEAKAQELLRQSIDPLVLQKMAIEKWDGRLPTYMGGQSVPFINIK
jgi:regulator of protease activity HflC (stomatin/prohibitin superfamily)